MRGAAHEEVNTVLTSFAISEHADGEVSPAQMLNFVPALLCERYKSLNSQWQSCARRSGQKQNCSVFPARRPTWKFKDVRPDGRLLMIPETRRDVRDPEAKEIEITGVPARRRQRRMIIMAARRRIRWRHLPRAGDSFDVDRSMPRPERARDLSKCVLQTSVAGFFLRPKPLFADCRQQVCWHLFITSDVKPSDT